MSLILEALRRSEAERRRGEAPDVLAPVEVVRPVSTHGLPAKAKWGAAALTVVVVAGAAWWQWAPTGTKAAAPMAAGDDLAATPSPVRMPAPAPHSPSAAQATATQPAVPSPARVDTAAPPPPPAPALAVPTASPVEPAPVPAAPAHPELIASAPARSNPPVDAPPPSPAAASAPSPEFISPEATVRLAELTSEERKQLPALKISMHMWAPDPANRFVIIDGARLEEGDRLADATVSAILADGVTLAWRGRQIRLPIR